MANGFPDTARSAGLRPGAFILETGVAEDLGSEKPLTGTDWHSWVGPVGLHRLGEAPARWLISAGECRSVV